ncbi:MAG TPA: serine hydrolase domain-containing protein [Polyangiaceae bacterium]|nr:serine hydrolase domain-containing protein [Polyangiaceae bacterium]
MEKHRNATNHDTGRHTPGPIAGSPKSIFVILCISLFAACGGTQSSPASKLAAATPPAASTAPPAPAILDLPRSRGGMLARRLLDAVNSGKDEVLRAFLKEHLGEHALELAPFDDWFSYFHEMAKQSGGVDVVDILPAPRPRGLVFEIRARRLNRYAKVVLDVEEQKDALLDFDARLKPDAAAAKAGALPSVAMSEQEVARVITQRVEKLGAADRFSGAVLVVKGDRVLVRAAQGQADKAFAAPNRIDTKFNLASMNKMFTAVAIAQLVEKGKLSFEDTLAKVLPDYPNKAFAESVTIHQLLSHTSGIGGNIFASPVFEHRERFKRPADYLPLFTKEPAEFPPGARYGYANAGFVVLGVVVERLSGEDYYDYVQNHLFAPAGMRDTASFAWHEATPNRAIGYAPNENDTFGVLPRQTNLMTLPFRGSPAGGGYSTVADLRAFAAALRGHKLLGKAMTETVTSPKVEMPYGQRKYGYGFESRLVHGKEIHGHSGAAPGINGDLEIFSDGSYIVAVLANYEPPAAQDVAGEIVEFLALQESK